MMGFQGTPARLFYDFCLDEHVPFDHMVRGIDRHLALDGLRQSLKPFYSQMGQPSVDPETYSRQRVELTRRSRPPGCLLRPRI